MDHGLMELCRKGNLYTWTNKQLNPVMSVLDRVLTCAEWDLHYGNASCETITRVGSDHNPIIVNTIDNRFRPQKNFRFEMRWLEQQGFRERVVDKWPIRRDSEHIQDFWRDVKAATRKFSRGWGRNFQAQIKRDKFALLEKIRILDKMAEKGSMTQHQWQERYNLEAKLEEVYGYEEIQLRRQSGVKWTLKGDANNSFFHGVANGRRKKCSIFSM
jgi:hypothetical protein